MIKIWLYAILGGFLPIMFWLFFWYKEDIKDQEPKWLIAKTFIYGVSAAFFSRFAEVLIHYFYQPDTINQLIVFSFTEEFFKFSAVLLAALGTVWVNEREDPILYMITGALGFAAIENTYYIIDYLNNAQYIKTLIDGGYRFIGATLLHTFTSAIIGTFIAIVLFQNRFMRLFSALLGLAVATGVHTLFNFFINHQNKFYNKLTFVSAWVAIVILLIAFQVIERIPNPHKKLKKKIIKKDEEFRKKFF